MARFLRVVSLLSGTGPAVIAVMALGIVRLGRTALVRWRQLAIAGTVTALSSWGVNPIALLAAAAIPGLEWGRGPSRATLVVTMGEQSVVRALQAVTTELDEHARRAPITCRPRRSSFSKVGSVLYGSGYVLIAFLQRAWCLRLAGSARDSWRMPSRRDRSRQGPSSPRPPSSRYVIDGFGGVRWWRRVAIFLPAFVLVALLEPVIARRGISPRLRGFLDAVNAASVGLLASATIQLAGQWLDPAIDVSVRPPPPSSRAWRASARPG